MRDFYESIPKYAKRLQNKPGESGVYWRTFDTYLKQHERRCSNFGHTVGAQTGEEIWKCPRNR